MSDTVYRPFDRELHLGEGPWQGADPKVQAWEEAHGHDVRMKCYVEFGCQAIQLELDRLEGEVELLRSRVTVPVQVCQMHGAPDDVVLCPSSRCQSGRVPMWSGYGLPAGTEACTICDGRGVMFRVKRQSIWLPPDRTWRPFCICRHLGVGRV